MQMFKKFALAAATVASMAIAAPSQAVITTFAAFTPIGTTRNVRWEKVGTAGGKFYTTSTGSASVPGAVNVKFTFLQNYFVTNNIAQSINASFNFLGTTANTPATLSNGMLSQGINSGSFSFRSQQAITVGNVTYAPGSNLLSGTFTAADLSGQQNGSAGGINDSTLSGSSVVYTSDFLDFTNVATRDFALSLTSINPVLVQANASSSLRTFRASAGGTFASDPAPIINGVPEPAIWGMMIAGFGIVGFQSRRRRAIKTVAA